ncbi:phage tail sheath family protein [Lachnospiraceae bacterium C1.1]|nr:phage tail sheath family protein [Lachnospiraceae bacterium C1.1]
MAEYLHPGVYTEEYDSGPVPMQGVSTSTAGFIGLAERGPVIGAPQFVTSFADYKRIYGSYLSDTKYGDARYLPYAVEQFFVNGGSRAYIMRVAPDDAKASSGALGCLNIEAASPGEWGDRLVVTAVPSSKARTQVYSVSGSELTVKHPDGFNPGDVVELFDGKSRAYSTVKSVIDKTVTLDSPPSLDIADKALVTQKYMRTMEITVTAKLDDAVETFENVCLNTFATNYIGIRSEKSDLVRFTVKQGGAAAAPAQPPKDNKDAKDGKDKDGKDKSAPAPAPAAAAGGTQTPFAQIGGNGSSISVTLSGGSEGSVGKVTADVYVGTDNGPGKRTGLQAFIENSNVSIMAIPGVTDQTVQSSLIAFCENRSSCFAILDIPIDKKKVDEIAQFRDAYDTTYAAIYHPWLQMLDPLLKRTEFFPPSGAMAGIYARVDGDRGVHKAPANETVSGCTGLSCSYNDAEQDILNPIGVNLVRAFTGRGIRVWGARTLSSNGLWKYINVRRLFIYVEQSIKTNTNWVVFEPNAEVLWTRVRGTIESFLATCWRDGALAGTSPDQAYFVECGPTTMTQDDIDNGRLICNIGIAPVKPAEFVIFRITQKTATS